MDAWNKNDNEVIYCLGVAELFIQCVSKPWLIASLCHQDKSLFTIIVLSLQCML